MSRHSTHGFTILELLLVIVVLGAQAALLMPVLEAAKERDRASACQSNLKQCALVLRMYSDDYDGTLPASALVANPPSQAQVVNFLTGKGEPFPKPPATKGLTWAQILQDNMKSTDIVFCPSDSSRTRVSYWYKYALDLAWRDSSLRKQKMGDCGYEALQVAFYEHSGWHTGDAAGIKNGVRINVAFIDSHVKTITVADGPTAYPSASDERTGASAIRLGEPMYYNFKDNDPNPGTTHSPGDFTDPSTCYDKL